MSHVASVLMVRFAYAHGDSVLRSFEPLFDSEASSSPKARWLAKLLERLGMVMTNYTKLFSTLFESIAIHSVRSVSQIEAQKHTGCLRMPKCRAP